MRGAAIESSFGTRRSDGGVDHASGFDLEISGCQVPDFTSSFAIVFMPTKDCSPLFLVQAWLHKNL